MAADFSRFKIILLLAENISHAVAYIRHHSGSNNVAG